MARVIWSRDAIEQVADIVDYIGRDNEAAARSLALRLFSSAEGLARFPRSGRIVPEFAEDDLRELIVDNYRLVYELLSPSGVTILAVVHAARDFTKKDLPHD